MLTHVFPVLKSSLLLSVVIHDNVNTYALSRFGIHLSKLNSRSESPGTTGKLNVHPDENRESEAIPVDVFPVDENLNSKPESGPEVEDANLCSVSALEREVNHKSGGSLVEYSDFLNSEVKKLATTPGLKLKVEVKHIDSDELVSVKAALNHKDDVTSSVDENLLWKAPLPTEITELMKRYRDQRKFNAQEIESDSESESTRLTATELSARCTAIFDSWLRENILRSLEEDTTQERLRNELNGFDFADYSKEVQVEIDATTLVWEREKAQNLKVESKSSNSDSSDKWKTRKFSLTLSKFPPLSPEKKELDLQIHSKLTALETDIKSLLDVLKERYPKSIRPHEEAIGGDGCSFNKMRDVGKTMGQGLTSVFGVLAGLREGLASGSEGGGSRGEREGEGIPCKTQ